MKFSNEAGLSLLVYLIHLILIINAYNIEEQKIGIMNGTKDSQFGYTVAIVQTSGLKTDKMFLVGAPNTTHDGKHGHGLMYKCSFNLTRQISCEVLDTSGSSTTCDQIRKTNETRSFCEQDSRLGSSMAVNRYYVHDMNMSSNFLAASVMVCAPGWKNTLFETRDGMYQNLMVGKCIKLTEKLEVVPCNTDGRFGCWPFWASPNNNTLSARGIPVFSYAEGGFSLAFTKEGYELVGGPGVDNWRGAFSSPKESWKVRRYNEISDTTYFGYDLKAGTFKMDANIVVGAPNFQGKASTGHIGQVVIYKGNDEKGIINFGVHYNCSAQGVTTLVKEDLDKLITLTQKGTKFGAVLETVDLTGDGYDEVLIGAPLYSGENPDEGRVFIYSFSKSEVCGPIAVLSGGARDYKLMDKTAFARFGTCIASVGDLDNNKFNDVAIGAPYENNGVGAIYIYNGGHSVLKDKFTQHITGRTVDQGIQAFGWSIYGNEDIDNNGFPDMIVGAYESDTAVVFRTKPVITVDAEIILDPNTIPLNTSLETCPTETEKLCFDVRIKLSYKTMGQRNSSLTSVDGLWKMLADTLYHKREESSRVVFLETKTNKFSKTLTLECGKQYNETITLIIKGNPEPKDIWTEVRIEGSFEITNSVGTDFDVLDPVIYNNEQIHITKDVEFDKKCTKVETCTSDLKVLVHTFITGNALNKHVENKTEIYIGEAKELVVAADVRSLKETSYNVFLESNVSAALNRPINSNHGIIGASCELKDHINTSNLTITQSKCYASNRLTGTRNVRVKFYYDISQPFLFPANDLKTMKDFVTIIIKAGQKNPDANQNNNIFEQYIPVKLKHKMFLEEDNNVEDGIFYTDEVESTRVFSIVQRFYVSNKGPSFLHLTYVNITVPVRKHGVEIAVIKNVTDFCTIIEDTYNSSKLQTIEGFGRFTENNVSTYMAEDDGDKGYKDIKTISCLNVNYDCLVIECKLTDMEPNQQEVLEFKIDIFESGLAKEKNLYGVKYATLAEVTDPFIWYGTRSNAWTAPVIAKKWTTFLLTKDITSLDITLWVIISSAVGSFVLTLLIIILWRCQFFERKRHYRIMDWKENRGNISSAEEDTNQASTSL